MNMMKGVHGNTKVLVRFTTSNKIAIITMQELHEQFKKDDEIIEIMSYNSTTGQNEWKPVIYSGVSTIKVPMKKMELNNDMDERTIIATDGLEFVLCGVTETMKNLKLEKQMLLLNDYRYTSNFSVESSELNLNLVLEIYVFRPTIYFEEDECYFTDYVTVSSDTNFMTLNRGYVNVADLNPNEDVVFYHDNYHSSLTFGEDSVIISDENEEYVYNISVIDNCNFYADGILVRSM